MPGTASRSTCRPWRGRRTSHPAHFSREFHRTFGATPHQYLLTRRMERAAALLRTTDRPETAEQVRSLPAKGAMEALFVTTEVAHATYDELKARGVEFTSEPTRMPYGIDAPFRDPFGNEFRMVQAFEESEA